jgi:hypothetical protein
MPDAPSFAASNTLLDGYGARAIGVLVIPERLRDEVMVLLAQSAVPLVCLVAGVLCLRHWRQSGDHLFAFFAVAFWLVGLNWTVLAVVYFWG